MSKAEWNANLRWHDCFSCEISLCRGKLKPRKTKAEIKTTIIIIVLPIHLPRVTAFQQQFPTSQPFTEDNLMYIKPYSRILFWPLVAVFAYVGGLVVFLSNLFQIVLHYSLRAIFLFIRWYHVKLLTSREGHRMGLDLPQILGQGNSPLYVSIQEPFQYVEGEGHNEAVVTDDSLHCHLNSSIDTCHNVDEGDSIHYWCSNMTWMWCYVEVNQSLQFAFISSKHMSLMPTSKLIRVKIPPWKDNSYLVKSN